MAVVYAAPRPIICPISKRDITHFFKGDPGEWVSCCAHILSKGGYRSWKLNPLNIMLMHPDAHRLIDAGTELQRQQSGWDFKPFYDKQAELKIKYREYQQHTKGVTIFRKDEEPADDPDPSLSEDEMGTPPSRA